MFERAITRLYIRNVKNGSPNRALNRRHEFVKSRLAGFSDFFSPPSETSRRNGRRKYTDARADNRSRPRNPRITAHGNDIPLRHATRLYSFIGPRLSSSIRFIRFYFPRRRGENGISKEGQV